MWRTFRIDRPREQRPLTRRLAIQRLEERLTLSSSTNLEVFTTTIDINSPISGGFVDVGVLPDGVTRIGDDTVPFLTNHGARSFLSIDSQGPTLFGDATDDVVIIGISNDGDIDFDSSDGQIGDLNIKVIPPPEFLPPVPEGGLIEISELTQIPNPQTSKSTSHESPSPLSTRQAREVTLSRGRDISFKVATLAPPRSIDSPTRVTFGENGHLPSNNATQNKTTSHKNFDLPSHEADGSVGAIVPRSTQSSSNVGDPVSLKAGATQPTDRVLPASHPISTASNHSAFDMNQAVATGPSNAPTPLLPSQPDGAGSAQEDARSQVFADWRNRDLLALPVLIALAASPRVIRRRRDFSGEIQQLPPQQSRQTIAL